MPPKKPTAASRKKEEHGAILENIRFPRFEELALKLLEDRINLPPEEKANKIQCAKAAFAQDEEADRIVEVYNKVLPLVPKMRGTRHVPNHLSRLTVPLNPSAAVLSLSSQTKVALDKLSMEMNAERKKLRREINKLEKTAQQYLQQFQASTEVEVPATAPFPPPVYKSCLEW